MGEIGEVLLDEEGINLPSDNRASIQIILKFFHIIL